mgnify:CR=1 FL=1|tara:strand:- start:587 stop:1036 length:450 start_codon:yes stop_codon:yes gene_type:complete
MVDLKRTNSNNSDFNYLNNLLDKELVIRDGDEHTFYAKFNKIDSIKHVMVAYEMDKLLGCGAFKKYDEETAEIKRMFVMPEGRGKKIASKVLAELEQWAKELGYKKCILETGITFKDAVGLYKNANYDVIPNYGQYKENANSICFSKSL